MRISCRLSAAVQAIEMHTQSVIAIAIAIEIEIEIENQLSSASQLFAQLLSLQRSVRE